MIECRENDDGTFTITWDQDDPVESQLNDWTEEDFVEVLMTYAQEQLGDDNDSN